MKLKSIDKHFINFLIHNPNYQEIIVNKLQKDYFLSYSRPWIIEVIICWINYFRFCSEYIFARATTAASAEFQAIYFYDENRKFHPERKLFLSLYRKAITFTGISSVNQFPKRPITLADFFRVLNLGIILFFSTLMVSRLTPFIIRTTRTSFLVSEILADKNIKEIYIFRIYKIESAFLSAYLKECDVTVHLIASTSPLTPYNQYLVGDTIKLCNPYQVDEYKYYQDHFSGIKHELWSPEEIVQLSAQYSSQTRQYNLNRLGLYTQGFWLRKQKGILRKIHADKLAEIEQELLEILFLFLQVKQNVQLSIFPHPIERQYFQKTNRHIFGKLINLNNVSIDFTGNNSLTSFSQIGLGITTISTIGFDRIFLGYRTLFYIPSDIYINHQIPSVYNSVFCKSTDELQSKILSVNEMTHEEYMRQYFGGEFWSPIKNNSQLTTT